MTAELMLSDVRNGQPHLYFDVDTGSEDRSGVHVVVYGQHHGEWMAETVETWSESLQSWVRGGSVPQAVREWFASIDGAETLERIYREIGA